MSIDLSILTQIVVGVLLLFAGGWISRLFERRPRLVVFYGHVGQFRLQTSAPNIVHTHAVVIRNGGRAPAKNVRVPHNGPLASANIHVSVDPPVPHTVQPLPNNREEILFPTLPAKTQVTVSYLYFPPITFNQINTPIYSDEGPAKVINVLPQVQWSKWVLLPLWALVFIGGISVCYELVELTRWMLR